QESAAGELEVGWCALLLAAYGGGLVVLAVTEFLTLFPSESGCPNLHDGCSLAMSSFRGLCCHGCGETFLLTWLLGVSRGGTWLFLPDLVEVGDVGACVVRPWSHVVAPVFRVVFGPTLAVGRGVTLFRCFVASFLAGSEYEPQESVAAVAGCACCERGCYFAHAVVGFVFGLHVRMGVSRRLRELAYGVAFTGAGLLPVDPGGVVVFTRAKQMFVCRVAPLVEHCDTYLWLLSALCWLVVNSGEVLPEFFSVGSGGGLFRACFCRLWCYLRVELCLLRCFSLLAVWFGWLVCVLLKVLPRITLLSLLAEGSVPCVQCEAVSRPNAEYRSAKAIASKGIERILDIKPLHTE
ncbi:hypothetical protein Taro_008385, partial [Colocasia esculenta]|nr:hypothetical protein [Colocasia esculenta]